MLNEYVSRNLQKKSFKNKDLRNVQFNASDLRGADFSGSDLSGARFIGVRTGITPVTIFLIFITALLVSAMSGYIAMLAGTKIHTMMSAQDWKIKVMGIATTIIIILFIIYTYWKGGKKAIIQLMVPIFFFSIIAGGMRDR